MPSMRTASRPALRALSIATVATGTPAGICTIESSASSPFSFVIPTGTPITGSGVAEAIMPGKWAAPPAPAMMILQPAVVRCPRVLKHVGRRAVSRDDPHLVRDAELGQGIGRRLHHRQVGIAAHDHADDRVPLAHRSASGLGSFVRSSTAFQARSAQRSVAVPITVTWPSLRPGRGSLP